MNITNLLLKNREACLGLLLASLFFVSSSDSFAAERTFKNSVSKNNDIFRMLEKKLIDLKNAGISTKDTQVSPIALCQIEGKFVDGETLRGEYFPECGMKYTGSDQTHILKQGVSAKKEVLDQYCRVFGYDSVIESSIVSKDYTDTDYKNGAMIMGVLPITGYWTDLMKYKPIADEFKFADEFKCTTKKECIEDSNCPTNKECQNNSCVDKPECSANDLSNCNAGQTCENNKCKDVYECFKSGNTVTLKVNGQTSETKTDSCSRSTQTVYACSRDNKSIESSINTCQYRCNSDGVTCDNNECNTSADCTDSSKPKCNNNTCVACDSNTVYDASSDACVQCTTSNLTNCANGQTCENNTCKDVYECSKSGNTVTLKVNGQTSETKTDSCSEGAQTSYSCSDDNQSITSSNNTCLYRCSTDGVTCDNNECNTSSDCTNSDKPLCQNNTCVACGSDTIFDSETNTCVQCTASNTSNCSEGQKCENNTCVDDIKPITPYLECVMDNGDNTFTAYFGYENNNQAETTIEACTTNANEANVITGLAEDYCNVTSTFELGRKKGIVITTFPSDKEITWTIQNGGNAANSAVANASSTKCADVTPSAKCIGINQDGSLEAYFGYKNDNEFDVIIPSGINNYSDPETQDLPTTFTAGNIEPAFRVRMEGTTASWTLNGVTAEANTSTATCNGNNAPTCQTTSYETDCQGTVTTITLDGSVCSDIDGTALSYSWETDCEGGTLENEKTDTATLQLTTPGEGKDTSCTVTLTVTDGLQSATSTQNVNVTACNVECPGTDEQKDQCGVCGGDGTSCLDCAGTINGNLKEDDCGICGGTNECLDCKGIPNGTNVEDKCGVCGGDGSTCANAGCIETNISSQKASINGDEFIKILKKQTNALLKDKPPFPYIRDLQASVNRRQNRANKLNNQIKSFVAEFSDVLESCTGNANCVDTDNSVALKKIEYNLKRLRAIVGRTIRQRNLNSKQQKKLLNKNVKLLNSKLAELKTIPTVSSLCE